MVAVAECENRINSKMPRLFRTSRASFKIGVIVKILLDSISEMSEQKYFRNVVASLIRQAFVIATDSENYSAIVLVAPG